MRLGGGAAAVTWQIRAILREITESLTANSYSIFAVLSSCSFKKRTLGDIQESGHELSQEPFSQTSQCDVARPGWQGAGDRPSADQPGSDAGADGECRSKRTKVRG